MSIIYGKSVNFFENVGKRFAVTQGSLFVSAYRLFAHGWGEDPQPAVTP